MWLIHFFFYHFFLYCYRKCVSSTHSIIYAVGFQKRNGIEWSLLVLSSGLKEGGLNQIVSVSCLLMLMVDGINFLWTINFWIDLELVNECFGIEWKDIFSMIVACHGAHLLKSCLQAKDLNPKGAPRKNLFGAIWFGKYDRSVPRVTQKRTTLMILIHVFLIGGS